LVILPLKKDFEKCKNCGLILIVNFDENEKVKNAEIKIKMMDGHPDYR